MSISVVVLTHNEEANLVACLESVSWSDDIHVVDSGSTDQTVEIARSRGAQVYFHALENFSAQRNWALRNLRFRHEWLLTLDADERIPPELGDEIRRAVAEAPPSLAAFEMRLEVYFLGRWIKYATQFGKIWFVRLFRHEITCYENRSVNAHPLVRGEVRCLRGSILHEDRKSVARLIDKYNLYSTLEAEETLLLLRGGAQAGLEPTLLGSRAERRRWLKHLHLRLPFRGVRKFFYLFLWRRGFLDGIPGLLFCLFSAVLEFMLSLKLGALKRNLPVTR